MQSLTGKNTGDTLTAVEWNQLPQEVQNVITAAGIGLSSGDLQQLNKSIVQQLSDGDFYDDQSGSANTVTAAPAGGRQGMQQYTRGAKIRVRIANTNTGPTTINVNSIGPKKVVNQNDSDLTGGELGSGVVVDLEYNPDFDGGSGALVFNTLVTEFPPNYLTGLKLENAADADHDFTMNSGSCRDADNTQSIIFNSTITKQIDVNWAEGNNDGGFPSGLGAVAADTTYFWFLIAKPDGTVDAGFDTSLVAANLLADATSYTKYRMVGFVNTDASANIIPGSWTDNKWTPDIPVADFTGLESSTATIRTLALAPFGIKSTVGLTVNVTQSTPTATRIRFSDVDQPDTAPTISNSQAEGDAPQSGGSFNLRVNFEVVTNASAQIRSRATNGGVANVTGLVQYVIFDRGQ